MKSLFSFKQNCTATCFYLLFIVVSITLAGCDILSGNNDENTPDDGIVRSVVKATVAPDGNVAGKITDVVLNFDVSMDPDEPGLSLQEGDQIRIILPDAFLKGRDLPLLNIFDCIPQLPQCDAVVPLLGWPQGALGVPPSPGYELSYENSHTMLITAVEDLIPDLPSNPGLKQIHLLLNSFTNPAPGTYPINVEVSTGDGIEYGTGMVRILSETQPSIEVTNAFHNFVNANYQKTAPDSLVPLPFDFLLWNDEGLPMEGVKIEENKLVQGSQVVGEITIKAPQGASGQKVFTEEPSTKVNAPVTGIPAGHLRVFVKAGSSAGEYRLTFNISAGNTTEMVVRVTDG